MCECLNRLGSPKSTSHYSIVSALSRQLHWLWPTYTVLADYRNSIYLFVNYFYFQVFSYFLGKTQPKVGSPYCYRRCPSLRPSLPPSRSWLTRNSARTLAAGKTIPSPFDRDRYKETILAKRHRSRPKSFLRSGVRSGVRNRTVCTASKDRQNTHIFGDISKSLRPS